MDGLSGAASVFSVVSLVIQLADGIKKLYEFCGSVKDAPEAVHRMVHELKMLHGILIQMQSDGDQYRPDVATTSVLEGCMAKVTDMMILMKKSEDRLHMSSRRVRKWRGVQVVLQKDKINELRLSLGETKTTLILARQHLSEQLQKNHHEQSLIAMNHGFASLQLSQKSNIVRTSARGLKDYNEHVQDLRAEIHHMVCAVANPLLQPGLEMAMASALHEYLAMVKEKIDPDNLPHEYQPTNIQVLKGIRNDVDLGTAALPHGEATEKDENIKGKSVRAPRPTSREEIPAQQLSYNIKTSFGTVYFRSRTFRTRDRFKSGKRQSSDQYEFETYFTWHPAPWLTRLGIKFGINASISKSCRGWRNTLSTFAAVPDDSLIFEFCKTGNIGGIQTLLTKGDASVRDTDTQGWTPLHFASWKCDLELCKLLLGSGADDKALTYDFVGGNYEVCSPVVTACTLSGDHKVSAKQRIDTVRLLAHDLDFTEVSEVNSQAWNMVLVLVERERPSSKYSAETTVSEWLLDCFRTDIEENIPDDQAAWIMTFVLEVRSLTEKVLDIKNDLVHINFGSDGFTPLQSKIAEGFPLSCVPSMKLLAERGANLHYVGCSERFGARFAHGATAHYETATSLSMRRSVFFFRWRQLLRELNVDFEEFVLEELKQFPLSQRGWEQDTLTALFNLDFAPVELPNQYCYECGREVFCVYKIEEDWWNVVLHRVKNSRDPYTGRKIHIEPHTPVDLHPDLSGQSVDEVKREDGDTSTCSLDSSIPSYFSCTEEWVDEEEEKLLCWKCGILQRTSDARKPSY